MPKPKPAVGQFMATYATSNVETLDAPRLRTLAKACGNADTAQCDAASSSFGLSLVSASAFNQYIRQLLCESGGRGARFKDDHNDTCMRIERSKNLNIVAYTVNYQDTPRFLTTRTTPATTAEQAEQEDSASLLQPPRGTRLIETADPLRAYWIKIEPEHVERRRGRGELEDICELSMIERKMAYGCRATSYGVAADGAGGMAVVNKVLSDVYGGASLKSLDIPASIPANVAAWVRAFQPCNAVFVALSSWPVTLFSLPPLDTSTGATASASASATSSSPSAACPRADTTVPVMFAEVNKEMSILHKVYVKSIEPKHFYQLPSVEYIEAFGTSLATGKDTYEKRKP